MHCIQRLEWLNNTARTEQRNKTIRIITMPLHCHHATMPAPRPAPSSLPESVFVGNHSRHQRCWLSQQFGMSVVCHTLTFKSGHWGQIHCKRLYLFHAISTLNELFAAFLLVCVFCVALQAGGVSYAFENGRGNVRAGEMPKVGNVREKCPSPVLNRGAAPSPQQINKSLLVLLCRLV